MAIHCNVFGGGLGGLEFFLLFGWLGFFLGGGGKEPVSCGGVQFSQKHSVYLEGVKDKMLIAILLTSKKKKNAT